MKTILIGTDGTEHSERAVERTLELAQALDAKVVVVSVAHVLTATHGTGGVDPTDPVDDHKALLDATVARLTAAGVAAEAQLGVGDPAHALVDAATEAGADLIVLGTSERNVIERALGMSVSGSVARHAPCDVLIVR